MATHARIWLAATVGALIGIGPASAQTALGTLRGVVIDEQGGALPGATVTARQADTNTGQTAVTSAEGQYFLPNLRPGRYEIAA